MSQRLGKADATAPALRSLAESVGVSGFPTILFFRPESDCRDGALATDGMEYRGERDASTMSMWLQGKLAGRVSSAAATRDEL